MLLEIQFQYEHYVCVLSLPLSVCLSVCVCCVVVLSVCGMVVWKCVLDVPCGGVGCAVVLAMESVVCCVEGAVWCVAWARCLCVFAARVWRVTCGVCVLCGVCTVCVV